MHTGLEFPEELFERYLSDTDRDSIESLRKSDIEKIARSAYSDFINETLSFDLFSSICEKLFQRLVVLKVEKGKLFEVLNKGTELSWYIRNDPERAAAFLKRIKDYIV
jgi:hypothetical protein